MVLLISCKLLVIAPIRLILPSQSSWCHTRTEVVTVEARGMMANGMNLGSRKRKRRKSVSLCRVLSEAVVMIPATDPT